MVRIATWKNTRTAFLAFVIGIIFSLIITAVEAADGSAYSNTKSYGPVNGYSYYNQAGIGVQSGYLFAETDVTKSGGGTVPTGYMGTKVIDYREGYLCYSSDVYYNPVAAGAIIDSQDLGVGCGDGTYYSKGITYAYNGNGYSAYNTNQSPNYEWVE